MSGLAFTNVERAAGLLRNPLWVEAEAVNGHPEDTRQLGPDPLRWDVVALLPAADRSHRGAHPGGQLNLGEASL